MADKASGSNSSSICKRCKSNVISGIKCKLCENSMHLSCAKLLNGVKFVGTNEVLCCDNVSPDESDLSFFDAMEDLSGTSKKVDIRIFNYIIKQKDAIIKELREKIDLINIQLKLMENKPNILNTLSVNPQKTDVQTNSRHDKEIHKKHESMNQVKTSKNNNNKQAISNTMKKGSSQIKMTDVAAAVLKEETRLKMDEVINLTNAGLVHQDPVVAARTQNENQEWQFSNKKKDMW